MGRDLYPHDRPHDLHYAKPLAALPAKQPELIAAGLGLSRVRFVTPILNVPQVAIIGIGGGLVERDFIGRSLTFDHRAVNGAPAADFLDERCQRLERSEVT